MQILNQEDPCCYYSEGREDAIISYQDDIRSVGVDFEVFIDTEHVGHEISMSALRVIYDDIQR